MTAAKFEAILKDIRDRQQTQTPMVQVSTANKVIRGRLAHSAFDPDIQRNTNSPFGIVAIEQPGLAPGPVALIQVADILDAGLAELSSCVRTLVGASS